MKRFRYDKADRGGCKAPSRNPRDSGRKRKEVKEMTQEEAKRIATEAPMHELFANWLSPYVHAIIKEVILKKDKIKLKIW